MSDADICALLKDALNGLVEEAQPLGIERPAYQAAIQALNHLDDQPRPVNMQELPREGTEFYFEGEIWRVVDFRYTGFGYDDLAIRLERINDDAECSARETFMLTSDKD